MLVCSISSLGVTYMATLISQYGDNEHQPLCGISISLENILVISFSISVTQPEARYCLKAWTWLSISNQAYVADDLAERSRPALSVSGEEASLHLPVAISQNSCCNLREIKLSEVMVGENKRKKKDGQRNMAARLAQGGTAIVLVKASHIAHWQKWQILL